MIPIKDYNPTRRFPIVTVLLMAVNIGVFLLVQRPFESTPEDEAEFAYKYAAIPCELVEGRPLLEPEVVRTLQAGDDQACEREAADNPNLEVFPDKNVWLSMLYSMFLHGGWLHIGGNMLFLWIFGNNIEDRMGSIPYLGFYLLAGFAATAAHVAVQTSSTVPVVGASGAIAGVMGAYLVLFPDVPIRTVIIFFLFMIRDIPARWLLLFWLALQFFTDAGSGVAWVAHVGGFIFGAVVALILRDRLRPPRVASAVDPYPYDPYR